MSITKETRIPEEESISKHLEMQLVKNLPLDQPFLKN